LEEKSLGEQADALRSGLTGLSDSDRALLDRGKSFDDGENAVESWRSAIDAVRERAFSVQSTIGSYESDLSTPPPDVEPEILSRAFAEYRSFIAEAKVSIDALIDMASKLLNASQSSGAGDPWKQWSDTFRSFRESYDAAVGRSSAHSDKMQQLKDIEDQHAKSSRETSRLREELRTLTATEAIYRDDRESWETLLRERDDLLDAQCRKLTESSGGSIRAGLKRFADPTGFVNGLRQSLSGSRIQGNKFDSLGDSISTAADPGGQWNSLLTDLERLAEFEPEQDGADRRPDTPTLATAGFTTTELDRLSRILKTENWLSLSLIPIQSLPIFEYRARENEYIPFRSASAGQQATALLKTLLNEPGPPLIIDQPEEDLDNPVILEIVSQVWTAKKKRQLIFASHNANLVVNGDSELVVWCDYRTSGDQSRGTIAGEGAIDVPDVREAIKRIMEGGEAAFNLRKQKYGF
jgi:type III restriction enzyme